MSIKTSVQNIKVEIKMGVDGYNKVELNVIEIIKVESQMTKFQSHDYMLSSFGSGFLTFKARF